MEHRCGFKPGDVYEDCAFHPVLCTEVVFEGEDSDGRPEWSLMGVSLVDGSEPRCCSTLSCGPVPIPLDQVRQIVRRFDRYVARRTAELKADAARSAAPLADRPRPQHSDLVVELFDRLAEAGVTALLKIDHERAENFVGRPWTLVVSGPPVGHESGYVRAEERSFSRCMSLGLRRLAEFGEEWQWVNDYREIFAAEPDR